MSDDVRCDRPPAGWHCNLERGHDGPCPTHADGPARGGTFDFWQEPHGTWSASVVVRIPGRDDWETSAGGFVNAPDALWWCEHQMAMAVADAS